MILREQYISTFFKTDNHFITTCNMISFCLSFRLISTCTFFPVTTHMRIYIINMIWYDKHITSLRVVCVDKQFLTDIWLELFIFPSPSCHSHTFLPSLPHNCISSFFSLSHFYELPTFARKGFCPCILFKKQFLTIRTIDIKIV